MANEKLDLIDREVLKKRIGDLHFHNYGMALIAVCEAPTVDAVEVDVVAQMLFDAFGDGCPCNYNGNDEWLPFVCDGNECVKHNDPLYCWKQYIKHYGERREGE